MIKKRITSQPIETTIAILSHNRSWHLGQCIASIRQFTKAAYKIYVLDVGSDLNHIEHMNAYAGPDIEFDYCEDFLSCLAGRRALLDFIDTEYVAYIDDDIRVGPAWLENMLRPMRADESAGAVAANIVQEGEKYMSGVRYLERVGASFAVRQHKANHVGQAELSCGGATLYRADVLRETELREEFSGGYEDWDQTLQITRDLKRKIYGSRATVFHKHMAECRDYFSDRWRWRELMDAALAMYERWNIRTAVDKTLGHYLANEIVIPREQAERIVEVIT